MSRSFRHTIVKSVSFRYRLSVCLVSIQCLSINFLQSDEYRASSGVFRCVERGRRKLIERKPPSIAVSRSAHANQESQCR